MTNASRQLTAHDWFLLVVLALIWGGSFYFARVAVLEIPPFTLVLSRVLLAAIALNIILQWKVTKLHHTRSLWLQFAMMGLLNNVIPHSLLFYGQQELGAGLASIINAMTPFWSLLIAHAYTHDERLSPSKILGVVTGMAGVGIMIGGAVFAGHNGAVFALMAVVGTTISYGIASVYGKTFAKVPPLETARGQLTMSTIMIFPVALLIDQPWQLPMPSALAIGSVILLALVCTAYAYILYFRILASAGAVNISLATLLVPASAILLGSVFLNEVLLPRHIIGLVCILIGLAAVDGRPFTFLRNTLIRKT
jgi:drug/metabolite transporter (DMT)-like permease